MSKELIAQLQEKERALWLEYCKVREEIRAQRILLAESEYGVKVGSIVKDRDNLVCKVIGIDAWLSGKPLLTVNPIKKDGSFGKSKRNLYSWELVTP
jgi:hypothetical protein